ncbi:hypothetical protein TrLO_g8185 [Triparma laevis f. longispina]|uniref:TNFR-Cys domain-containing protein n=1 Tax=Triparma laevis f. longispina TaxID=1714387 RepID=A0A9W7AY16_9STRA|nr:hypothetical protein TrLO_g8185 [Triparma laevis f. longispina]
MWHGVELLESDVAALYDELSVYSCPAGSSNPTQGRFSDSCVSCVPGKWSDLGSISCTACTPGSFSGAASTSCTACSAGKYLLLSTTGLETSACAPCPSGGYSAASSMTCAPCMAGKYLVNTATSIEAEACTTCPAGSYSDASSSVCIFCPKGSHNEDDGINHLLHNGVEDCRLCAPGRYSASENGAQYCDECPSGKLSGAGAESCGACPAGYVCTSEGQTPCPPGQYSNNDSNCKTCEPGYKCPGSTDRMICSPGSSQPSGGQDSCIPCAAGTFQPSSGHASCLPCSEGHFCPKSSSSPIPCGSVSLFCPQGSEMVQAATAGSYTLPASEESITTRRSQQTCEVGNACVGGAKTSCVAGLTFQTHSGQTSCQSCSVCGAGKYFTSVCTPTSDTVCGDCDLGKFSTGGQSSCDTCTGEGEYSDEIGLSACKIAPAGSKPTSNRHGVEICAPGTYSVGGTDDCTNCESGKFSSAGAIGCTSASTCGAGKFVKTPSTFTTDVECEDCAVGKASAGGQSSCAECDEGHVAPTEGLASCSYCGGGKYASTTSNTCELCQPSTYSVGGKSSCLSCESNTYTDTSGATVCVYCDAGQIPSSDQQSCVSCDAGHYSNIGDTTCSQCLAGLYSSSGSGVCSYCDPGTYSTIASATCTICPGGRVSSNGAASCSDCVAGKYDDGNNICQPCPAGSFSSAGSTACDSSCPAGTYGKMGETSCSECEAGKFAALGAASCELCLAGTYSGSRAGECSICAAGKVSSAGAMECNACEGGFYSHEQSSSCSMCTSGKYSGDEAGVCSVCVAGRYSGTGASSCAICTAGKYSQLVSETEGASTCTDCDSGKFSSEGSESCAGSCLPGTYGGPGSSICVDCGAGTYSEAGADSCINCPGGKYSGAKAGLCVNCDAGKFSGNAAASCETCVADQGYVSSEGQSQCEYCGAEGQASCSYCGAGKYASTTSNTCELCQPSTYSVGGKSSCLSCESNTYTDTSGATVCVYCDAGQIPSSDQQSCVSCDAGHYSNIGDTTCSQCLAGLYSSSGSGVCSYCDPGTYSTIASATCTICPGGRVSSNGAASCSDCVAGKYDDGNNICQPCAAGTFSSAGSTSCDSDCPAGTFGRIGETSCSECEAGKFAPLGADSCQLCEAGTYSGSRAGECTDCTAGTFSSMGAEICTPCEAGFHAQERSPGCSMCTSGKFSEDEAGECSVCSAGKMSGTGASSCATCAAGKYSQLVNENQGANHCTDCDAGKFSSAGSASCSGSCEAGTYGGIGSSVCLDCSPGAYSDAGASSCINCVGGTYSGAKAPSCSTCDAGKYSSNAASSCEACHASQGRFIKTPSTSTSNSECEDCAIGKASIGGQLSCGDCDSEGEYSDETGLPSCKTVPSGHKSTANHGGIIAAGKYSPLASYESCNDCEAGKFSNEANMEVCKNCADFNTHTTSVLGSTSCTCKDTFVSTIDPVTNTRGCTCEPGFTLENGVCVQCQNGFFKSSYGLEACSSCDKYAVKGAIQTDPPATTNHSCLCSIGEFWLDEPPTENPNNLKAQCYPCPEGVDCSTSGSTTRSLNVDAGYWRSSQLSFDVEQCYNSKACQPLNDTKGYANDFYCTDGHTGPLCNICQDGYVMSVTGVCNVCKEMKFYVPDELIVFISVMLALVVALIVYKRCSRKKEEEDRSRSSTGSRGRKPSILSPPMLRRESIESASIPDNDIGQEQGKDESQNDRNSIFNRVKAKGKILTSFYQIVSQYEHVLQVRFPVVFEQFARWVYSVTNLDALKLVSFGCIYKTDYHFKLLFSTLTPIILSLLIFGYYLIRRSSNRVENERRLNFCMTTFLALTYLIFSSVSTTLFKTFQCKRYGDDPTSYLIDDHQIDCDSKEHKFYELYAALMMIVYPIGITGLYAVLLFRKKDLLKTDEKDKDKDFESLKSIAFLWEMYEPRVWWFEIFECIRRLSMTGMLVFVDPGSPTQIVVAILNSIISIVMYSHIKPFQRPSDDSLAIVSSWSIFFTLFGAFMVKTDVDDQENYNDNDIFGYLLIAVNCAGIGLVVLEMAVVPIHYILHRLMTKHFHDRELKGPPEDNDPAKFWDYVETLLHSDEDEAGWQQIHNVVKDSDFKDWVNDYRVSAEWRCSHGNGPIDQVRAKMVIYAEKKKVLEFLLDADTQHEDESDRSIISSSPDMKRYYVAKKMLFPFYDRDFVMEEWTGDCKALGNKNQTMVIARSCTDLRRHSEKSSASLKRTRGEIEIFAYLLESTRIQGTLALATQVTFIGGGFDMKGLLFTDLLGRIVYVRLMQYMLEVLDIKFNPEGKHFSSKRLSRRKLGQRTFATEVVANAIIEKSRFGSGFILGSDIEKASSKVKINTPKRRTSVGEEIAMTALKTGAAGKKKKQGVAQAPKTKFDTKKVEGAGDDSNAEKVLPSKSATKHQLPPTERSHSSPDIIQKWKKKADLSSSVTGSLRSFKEERNLTQGSAKEVELADLKLQNKNKIKYEDDEDLG